MKTAIALLMLAAVITAKVFDHIDPSEGVDTDELQEVEDECMLKFNQDDATVAKVESGQRVKACPALECMYNCIFIDHGTSTYDGKRNNTRVREIMSPEQADASIKCWDKQSRIKDLCIKSFKTYVCYIKATSKK